MKTFLTQLTEFFKNLGSRILSRFKKLFQTIKEVPKIKDYANQTGEKKAVFYLGTTYLTVRGIFKQLFYIILFGGFLAVGIGIGFAAGILRDQPVPTLAQMDKQINNTETSSTLYYSGNEKIATVKSDVISTQTKSSNISPLVKNAVIATEDETFYEHKGVLPKSLIRAVFSELTGLGTSTGGSTLTQQLVKMQFLTDQTTWKRKIIEMFFARKIEKHFSKDQIITAYLNTVPFGKNNAGQNIAGIEEAAQGIFGKTIKQLTLPQAAFIAGLPQSPSVYTPFTITGKVRTDLALGLRRKDIVLFRMYRNDDITKKQYEAALKYDLKKGFLKPAEKQTTQEYNNYLYNLVTNKSVELLANNLIEQDGQSIAKVKTDAAKYQNFLEQASELIKEKGYHVHTTIKKNLYQIMSSTAENSTLGQTYQTTVYDENLNKYVNVTEKAQNGSVMIDNSTGKVLAFAGGVDFDASQINHAFSTYRSPGSSIKPYLVYAPAVENKLISSKTVLPDFPTNFGRYIPTDYGNSVENRFINADEALKMSYNLPAVNLYNVVRKNTPVESYMNKLGFNIEKSEYDELGLALGGTKNGFSVAQNAAAFATFNNDGDYSSAYYIDKIVDPSGKVVYQHKKKKTKVYSSGTSYVMKKMLHEVTTSGTAAQLNYSLDFDTDNLIGKTGTSDDYRDIWFNGSTPGVTISSWMGYDNYYGHSYNLSSNASATNLSLWAEMANELYAADPKAFKLDTKQTRPDSVRIHSVLNQTGTKPGSVTYNGQTINLTGLESDSYSLLDSAPEASAEFAVGAKAKDYKLFFDYKNGISNGYGERLHYNGKTLNDDTNLDDLFVTNTKELDDEYYGNQTTKPDDKKDADKVEGNDKEPQTGAGGSKPNESQSSSAQSSTSKPPATSPSKPPTQ